MLTKLRSCLQIRAKHEKYVAKINLYMTQVMENNSTSQIEIVRLPVSEWQSYKTLRLRALKVDPKAFGSSYEKESQAPDEKWQERLSNDNWILFAKAEGQLVGMMGAFQTETDKASQTANIYGVYVAQEARGKGVSGMLMEKLLGLLNEKSIVSVKLSVNKDQLAAVALYQKFGFEVAGEEDMVLGDGINHTELLMTKSL